MRKTLLAAAAAALTAFPCFADAAPAPKIQLAILIDTSGSMDGLINQTREQLWRIVNTFASAKKEGRRPTLELALYEYGNDGIPAEQHHVRRVVPLTTDLDKVSEALFALRTNGGNEYCGAAISHATGELTWSDSAKDLKLIYIAGNEPFSQGPIGFREAVRAAIGQGIVVNTIHAGPEQQGVAHGWLEGAKLADGNYLAVDANRAVARVDAPQDAEMVRLNEKLNRTYLAYGEEGRAAATRQARQDANAAGMSGGSMARRAAAKASAAYSNEAWDLVDAKKAGMPVAAAPAAALPVEMQAMSAPERDAYVEQKGKERAELQAQIQKLAREREAYVQAELAKRAKDGAKTLDDALIESARTQAVKAKFDL